MIRPCDYRDLDTIHAIINDGAEAYRGIIPLDLRRPRRRFLAQSQPHGWTPMKISRRTLLQQSLTLAGGVALSRALPAQQDPPAVLTLFIDTAAPAITVPADFTGLGYELSSAARTGLLSAKNDTYVRLVQQLGSRGVLRLGGIVADFTSYAANGISAHEPKHTVITRANLIELRGFLDRTGWTCIWSVNFGAGTLPDAIEEACAVRDILGPRLLALELGNEVDNYGRGPHPLRKPPYAFSEFLAEYAQWHRAIHAVAPGIRFAAPDAAADSGWLEQMAATAHGDVDLLTQHYYRGGQKQATLDQLLLPDIALAAQLQRIRVASEKSRIPWRMCETASFYGGGRPGLSDTLAGALWTLDYMLLLAQNGCSGVNLETGFNQLRFLSSYSPIRNDEAGNASIGAPYHGMLAFAQSRIAGGMMHPVKLRGAAPTVTAYASTFRSQGKALVIVNRGESPLKVRLSDVHGPAKLLRLEGPSLTGTSGITLGGAQVDSHGNWSPNASESLGLQHPAQVDVRPYSAVIVQYAKL